MGKLSRAVKIAKAKLYGIKNPHLTMQASEKTGVPFYILCAFLEQESAGGANVFGHDNSIYRGAGKVTKEKYLAYRKARDAQAKRRMQGVGPMQLTWWEYQDAADALGGCWLVRYNILEGARILAQHYVNSIQYRGDDINGRWRYVAYKYNGKQSYVDSIQPKFDKWKARVG